MKISPENLTRLKKILNEEFQYEEKFIPGKTKILLNAPTYGLEEIIESLDSLLSTWVTMGKKTKKFEDLFAEYLSVKKSLMVNSGSTANLIALSILSSPFLEDPVTTEHEVVTPALTWSTTVFPILDVGASPVLVDIDLDTLTIDVNEIEKALSSKTKAIMPVHLLGNPCDMKTILEIAKRKKLFVIEDCCEAHGAEFDNRKVGTFGDLGTFSFFFSHHISTIEGGMVVSDNEKLIEIAKPIRAHGWPREMESPESYYKANSNIDPRFLFIHKGYNVRPTDLQGGFGIHQIKKLDSFIEIRRIVASALAEGLSNFNEYFFFQKERENSRHTWFGFPIVVKQNSYFSRNELVDFLEKNKIETRPVMAGNMARQPVMKHYRHRVVGELKNTNYVMDNGVFIPVHHQMKKQHTDYILNTINDFIKSRKS